MVVSAGLSLPIALRLGRVFGRSRIRETDFTSPLPPRGEALSLPSSHARLARGDVGSLRVTLDAAHADSLAGLLRASLVPANLLHDLSHHVTAAPVAVLSPVTSAHARTAQGLFAQGEGTYRRVSASGGQAGLPPRSAAAHHVHPSHRHPRRHPWRHAAARHRPWAGALASRPFTPPVSSTPILYDRDAAGFTTETSDYFNLLPPALALRHEHLGLGVQGFPHRT